MSDFITAFLELILDPITVGVCVLTGVAVGALAWAFAFPFGKLAPVAQDARSNEVDRRRDVSAANPIYGFLQPLVLELASVVGLMMDAKSKTKMQHSLQLAEEDCPWHPEEFVAVKLIEAIFIGPMVGFISLVLVDWMVAIAISGVVALIYVFAATAGVHEKAGKRLRSLKMRLPFAVDLMALMIEAGATFRDSLITVVRENKGHPLGDELRLVDQQIELGLPRADALRSMQDRLEDQDVSELIFAINKGEELGTPLASILRNQADQMRLKRSQWGEKAAAEAEIKMTFPGMVVMLACMLVVLAPIMLPALKTLQAE